MILQPLVENSIIHGFARKSGKGIILIKAHADKETLILSICDNGCGVELNDGKLPETPESGTAGTLTRVGIKNVNRRIILNYGENFGIQMISMPGFYCRTKILLPLNKEVLNDNHHDS